MSKRAIIITTSAIVGAGAVGALIYFWVDSKKDKKLVDCILKAVGIDEPTGKFGDIRDYEGDYLSPTYFSEKSVKDAVKKLHPNDWESFKDKSLSRATMGQVMIRHAFGAWYEGGDNESQIYSAFKGLNSRWEASIMAWVYAQRTSRDLLEDLRDKLDATELEKIKDIIQSKPKFS